MLQPKFDKQFEIALSHPTPTASRSAGLAYQFLQHTHFVFLIILFYVFFHDKALDLN